MRVIRCTSKLLRELGVLPAQLAKVEEDPPHGSWFANLIRIERRKCILFTNSRTLYSFFVAGVRKADVARFTGLFAEHAALNLRSENLVATYDFFLGEPGAVAIAKTNSRSVLGSMNDITYELKSLVDAAGGLSQCDVVGINRDLNRMPMGAIGYDYAVDRMRDLPS